MFDIIILDFPNIRIILGGIRVVIKTVIVDGKKRIIIVKSKYKKIKDLN
jgi:hypothetical protein